MGQDGVLLGFRTHRRQVLQIQVPEQNRVHDEADAEVHDPRSHRGDGYPREIHTTPNVELLTPNFLMGTPNEG